MTMHLYQLVREGAQAVECLSPVWTGSRVRFHGDWYEARGDCIRHAIEHNHTAICIVAYNVELYHWPLGHKPARMDAKAQHGLWLYLNRLACRYGHVYVPPLAWAKNKRHEYFLAPTIPMVAAYQVKALQALDNVDTPSLGKNLCAAGYDSFNVSDYFHFALGDDTLDEFGSTTTWRKTYESAINRILGPSH